jgi:hypothetical protein
MEHGAGSKSDKAGRAGKVLAGEKEVKSKDYRIKGVRIKKQKNFRDVLEMLKCLLSAGRLDSLIADKRE